MGIIKTIIYGLFGLNVLANMYYAGAYAYGKKEVREGKSYALTYAVSGIAYTVLIYLMWIDW